jgi:hypothetical protein
VLAEQAVALSNGQNPLILDLLGRPASAPLGV